MLQQLWNYFETTGDITLYLGFKEYEAACNNKAEILEDRLNTNEIG
ncbi:YqzL family protein [Cellulosilyticum sp. I15G10I2]|nr:YqzL family protein [Cellulosilyticum sp. I15G10I2]